MTPTSTVLVKISFTFSEELAERVAQELLLDAIPNDVNGGAIARWGLTTQGVEIVAGLVDDDGVPVQEAVR